MTIFVDASALVSMVAGEPDALALAGILEPAATRFCSALALWETVAGLCRSHMFSVESARDRVAALCRLLEIQLVAIGAREYEIALSAYAQFGKGRHPAGLNMGDCFAYACARANNAALLCKGEDFTRTDIRIAGRQA